MIFYANTFQCFCIYHYYTIITANKILNFTESIRDSIPSLCVTPGLLAEWTNSRDSLPPTVNCSAFTVKEEHLIRIFLWLNWKMSLKNNLYIKIIVLYYVITMPMSIAAILSHLSAIVTYLSHIFLKHSML